MREFFRNWRRKVGCAALVLMQALHGCSGRIDPHQQLVDRYLAETDLGFRVLKRYGTATSDDQLVRHLATEAAQANDPTEQKRILKAQSWLPFTATRAVFRMEGQHTDDDALFIIRNGDVVVDVYYLRNELDGRLFAEFAERAFR